MCVYLIIATWWSEWIGFWAASSANMVVILRATKVAVAVAVIYQFFRSKPYRLRTHCRRCQRRLLPNFRNERHPFCSGIAPCWKIAVAVYMHSGLLSAEPMVSRCARFTKGSHRLASAATTSRRWPLYPTTRSLTWIASTIRSGASMPLR